MLQADADTRFLVLEMGARGLGHLRYLCEIAPPRIGVVVNVGVAHIGEFGSVEAIAAGQGRAGRGAARRRAGRAQRRRRAGRARWRRVPGAAVVLVGEAADADVRAEDVELDERGRAVVHPGHARRARAPVRLGISRPAPGRQHALAAAAVARALGMPLAELAPALGDLRLVSTRRMDVFDRADGVTVIDDSYNANPASTAAALRALAAMGAGGGRSPCSATWPSWAAYERSGHEEVGRLAAELGVDLHRGGRHAGRRRSTTARRRLRLGRRVGAGDRSGGGRRVCCAAS